MSLWDYVCPIHEKFKTERLAFAKFIKQYDYLIPNKVNEKIIEVNDEYKKDNFKKVRELIIDAEILLNSHIGIEKSQGEIKKRLELLSK